MSIDYLIYLVSFVALLSNAEHQRSTTINYTSVLSFSSVFDADLILDANLLDVRAPVNIAWFKGIVDWKPLVSDAEPLVEQHEFEVNVRSQRPRYHLVNRTRLVIEHTRIGDEGFYTLILQYKSRHYERYLYHVVLFTRNLSLSISPSQLVYRAEQQVNFTCSILLFADHSYLEQSGLLFLSPWQLLIYDNDPDDHQLFFSPPSSHIYTVQLLNFELDPSDHNRPVSCALVQQYQKIALLNVTLTKKLNVEYKAYLRGNYYFTRSFSAHSSIEIDCEEFDGNPKPTYTLVWMQNNENRTLLRNAKQGRYRIDKATWRNRGNYICFAENYLNHQQPAYQLFRLNIWFDEHHPHD